jgi:hypothetical protein
MPFPTLRLLSSSLPPRPPTTQSLPSSSSSAASSPNFPPLPSSLHQSTPRSNPSLANPPRTPKNALQRGPHLATLAAVCALAYFAFTRLANARAGLKPKNEMAMVHPLCQYRNVPAHRPLEDRRLEIRWVRSREPNAYLPCLLPGSS